MTLWAVVLPLAAAFIYVMATLLIKKSVFHGANARHVNFVANVAMGVFMQPLWLLPSGPSPWWQPLICGVLFFIGQCLTFAALSRGDVSVATPLMGTKILFISGFSVLFLGLRPAWDWWTAVVLSTLAVVLVTARPGTGKARHLGRTALLAVSSAACFGLTDLLVQVWCEPETLARFIAMMFSVNGLLAILWYLAQGSMLPPRPARLWLLGSGTLLAVQVLFLAVALGVYNDATATNILYSTRSVWSVVLAWSAGHWFGARDAEAGSGTMILRLSGALLLCAAIFLIVT